METSEDDRLKVETCVTQINKKVVALTVEFTQQDSNYNKK
jgi:hypothetical protein